MGGADLVLDGMTREEALALVAAAANVESERPSAGASDTLLSSAGRHACEYSDAAEFRWHRGSGPTGLVRW